MHRLVGALSAGALGLALNLELMIGGAAAEIAEPSLALAAHAFALAAVTLWALGASFDSAAARYARGRSAQDERSVARAPRARVLVPLALLAGTAWLSLAGAEDLHAGLRRATGWTAAAGLACVAIALAASSRAARAALLACVLAAAAVVAGLAARERFVEVEEARAAYLRDPSIAGIEPDLDREFRARLFTDQASGPFVIPNGLGAYLAVAALPAAGLAAALARSAARGGGAPARGGAALAGGLAAALVLAIPLAGQKGSWLGLAAGALAGAAALAREARPRLARALAGGGAAAAAALALAVAMAPVERLERLPGGTSLAVRKEYAITALRMAAEAPALGAGAGNYFMHASRLKPERGEETRYAHDDYLEVLAEQGPLGLAGLIALWIALLGRRASKLDGASSPEAPRARSDAGLDAASSLEEPRSGNLPGIAIAAGAGGALAFLLLPALGLRYRDPATAVACAAGFAALYALLVRAAERAFEAEPAVVAAGALAGAAAFAVQSAIDFLHPESGLLLAALALAATAGGPALARPLRVSSAARAALVFAALGAFVALTTFFLPRAILRDAAAAEAGAALRAGDLDRARRAAEEAAAAVPFDPHARALLGDVLAALHARRPDDPRRRAAAIEQYRAAIEGRRGLPGVKARLADLLPPEEAAAALEAAARAYPGHPRYRFLAGRALLSAHPERARAHLEAALRLDPAVRHERNRLRPQEISEARTLLDRIRARGL